MHKYNTKTQHRKYNTKIYHENITQKYNMKIPHMENIAQTYNTKSITQKYKTENIKRKYNTENIVQQLAGVKTKHLACKVGMGEAWDTATTRRGRFQGVGKVLKGIGTSNITVWFRDLCPFGGNGK